MVDVKPAIARAEGGMTIPGVGAESLIECLARFRFHDTNMSGPAPLTFYYDSDRFPKLLARSSTLIISPVSLP